MNGNNYNYSPRMSPEKCPVNRRKKKRPLRHKIIIAAVLIIYALILGAVTYLMLYRPDTGGVDTYIEYATDENGNMIETVHEFTQRDGIYNFLILGEDREAGLTDVCMILNFDTASGKIGVLQLPRDTYVRSVDGVNITSGKINELFADHYRSRQRSGESEDKAYRGALDDVTGLLEKSLCIRINFSVIMDLDGFRGIVDAIGGVEMNITSPMVYDDPAQGLYINIPVGYQTLDGEAAEHFIRFRHDYIQGDLGRVNAQKMFLSAFFTKLKSCGVSQAADIAGEVFKNVTTDLTLSDTVFFAKKAVSANLSDITMQTLPGQVAQTSASHYVMNRAAALKAVNRILNVYENEITSGIFDSVGMFNSPGDEYISSLYYSDEDSLYDGNVYTGDGVADNGIDIPLKK